MKFQDRPLSLHEKIARQKKLEQAQIQTMMDVYSHYQNGTFLSLDVVGSTKLKEGEDSIIVVDSFKAFHTFITHHISRSASSVFSGDGVMCLFKDAQYAVNAALNIFNDLERFNKNHSRLKGYFNLRMGINSGTILLEDEIDLGKLTERNIDIAGHFQKYARPGQLLVAQSTLDQLSQKNNFIRKWRTIDKTTVYQYKQNFSPGTKKKGAPLFSRSTSTQFNDIILGSLDTVRFSGIFNIFSMLRSTVFLAGLFCVLIISIGAFFYKRMPKDNPSFLLKWPKTITQGINNTLLKARIVNNRIKYGKSWHHLGDVKMKIDGTWQDLPRTVYLIIPSGKNSKNNYKIGVKESTITVLKRGINNKYYTELLGLGMFIHYVETYSGYYIFKDKKIAEKYLATLN